MSGKILLVEDEELIGTTVKMSLEGAGYEVQWSVNGQEALRIVEGAFFDLILLDISLPEVDGIEVLTKLREQCINSPVMMLTARSDVPTKVKALEKGADDYLPKPFDVKELIARVQAQLRRSQADRELPSDQIIRVGKHTLNLERREARSGENRITLSEKEAAIMRFFYRTRGQVISRPDILEEVWGMDVSPTERTIDNFIMRLRTIFEADAENPKHILTVRGVGYRFII